MSPVVSRLLPPQNVEVEKWGNNTLVVYPNDSSHTTRKSTIEQSRWRRRTSWDYALKPTLLVTPFCEKPKFAAPFPLNVAGRTWQIQRAVNIKFLVNPNNGRTWTVHPSVSYNHWNDVILCCPDHFEYGSMKSPRNFEHAMMGQWRTSVYEGMRGRVGSLGVDDHR